MKNTINKTLYKKILEKFEIIEIIDTVDYDHNNELLESTIKNFENYVFVNNQRILILYQDTGFYNDLTSGTSVVLNNLFFLLKKYKIPQEFIIFISNHYGIKKELAQLENKTGYSISKVIECSLWYDFPTYDQIVATKNLLLEFENEFLYTCLNNVQRIHRSYSLCQLKENNLLNHGIISYRFNK
jgi:hypothetical protein